MNVYEEILEKAASDANIVLQSLPLAEAEKKWSLLREKTGVSLDAMLWDGFQFSENFNEDKCWKKAGNYFDKWPILFFLDHYACKKMFVVSSNYDLIRFIGELPWTTFYLTDFEMSKLVCFDEDETLHFHAFPPMEEIIKRNEKRVEYRIGKHYEQIKANMQKRLPVGGHEAWLRFDLLNDSSILEFYFKKNNGRVRIVVENLSEIVILIQQLRNDLKEVMPQIWTSATFHLTIDGGLRTCFGYGDMPEEDRLKKRDFWFRKNIGDPLLIDNDE